MFFGILTKKFDESFVKFCMFSCIWGSYLLPFQIMIQIITPIGIAQMSKKTF